METNNAGMEDFMLQKKLDIMFEMNNKKIANEINKLSSMISQLNGEIASIRKEMGKANPAELRQNQSNAAVAKQDFEGFREIPSNSVRPKPSDDPKPRYGDYNPEDVPIGKIFYFGNKKPR